MIYIINDQCLNSQNTLPISSIQASYGVSIVTILESLTMYIAL